MIWDGVTEYSNAKPPWCIDRLFACACTGMALAGSAKVRCRPVPDARPICFGSKGLGWDPIGVTFTQYPHYGPTDYRNGGFLHYDGSLSFEPPNQYFQIINFRAHAARFAHQLQVSMGHHDHIQPVGREPADHSSDLEPDDRRGGAAVSEVVRGRSPTEMVSDGGDLTTSSRCGKANRLITKRTDSQALRALRGRRSFQSRWLSKATCQHLKSAGQRPRNEIYAPNRTTVPWQRRADGAWPRRHTTHSTTRSKPTSS